MELTVCDSIVWGWTRRWQLRRKVQGNPSQPGEHNLSFHFAIFISVNLTSHVKQRCVCACRVPTLRSSSRPDRTASTEATQHNEWVGSDVWMGRRRYLSPTALSLFSSFSLPDLLCDATDLIWRYGTPFEAMTGRTAFMNFKCGLGLERGPPSLVRTIG